MTIDGSFSRAGGCACGMVRFQAQGEPLRSGLCHCLTCQQAHGGPCFPFVVFKREQVNVTGHTVSWLSTSDYDRRFCESCGSRIASVGSDEIELPSTSFDEPGLFPPQYEIWTIRRVPWLTPLDVQQYDRNRED